MIKDILSIWPDAPALSIAIWVLIAIVLLYVARPHAHQAINAMGRVISAAMRHLSHSLIKSAEHLRKRNREVLLAAGAEHLEREIEREFQRVNKVVERDLQGYPALQRTLGDLVVKIDEDYRESTEVPPSPPGWTDAIEAVAKIPPSGDTMVSRMLGEINKSLNTHHKEAMKEYRKAGAKRHELLKRILPYWRKVKGALDDLGKSVTGLHERSVKIDRHMEQYEQIRNGTEAAERTLSASATTQFFISALVLGVAIGGAFINFHLIALPMSEMVGGGSYIGDFKTSNIAALVIILIEIAMGLFLMETLRFTRLFPVISALDDRKRIQMAWTCFGILLTLACVESALAYMRDMIAMDMQALRQTLAGTSLENSTPSRIPMIGQMAMGFVLPFALTFIAIPFESFVHSSRIVIGHLILLLISALAYVVRLIGLAAYYTSNAFVKLYDLLVFIPLQVEAMVRKGKTQAKAAKPAPGQEVAK